MFWGSASAPYHVGIYVGDGQYVHAATPSQGVRKQAITAYFYPSAAKRVLNQFDEKAQSENSDWVIFYPVTFSASLTRSLCQAIIIFIMALATLVFLSSGPCEYEPIKLR